MKIKPDDFAQAKDYAYRLLSYRERSEREIKERLARKGFDEVVSEKVAEDLKAAGLIDDYRFAKAFAEGRVRYRPSGLELIRSKLYSKGIDGEIVNSVISAIEGNYDEYAAAHELAGNRAKKFGKINREKAKQRIYGYLLRRRFKKEVVYKVLNEIFSKGDRSEAN